MERQVIYDLEADKYIDVETAEVIEITKDNHRGILNKQIIYGLTTQIPFGKHKGKTIEEVLYNDDENGYSYIYWMYDEGFKLSKEVLKESNKHTKERRGKKSNNKTTYTTTYNTDSMLRNLKSNLDNKHWQHAFNDEDLTIGDFNDSDFL